MRCCWLCEMGRSGYQRKGLQRAHILFFLSVEIYTHVAGEPSPQSCRVFLGHSPVQAVSVFGLECRCRHHTFGLPFRCTGLHSCEAVLLRTGSSCLNLLHGSRSESHTGACNLPLLEKDDSFFPAHRELNKRKSSKCCWPVLHLSLLEVTGCPQLTARVCFCSSYP